MPFFELVNRLIAEEIATLQRESVARLQLLADYRRALACREWEYFQDAGILSAKQVDELRFQCATAINA